jgi:hypothetical protein
MDRQIEFSRYSILNIEVDTVSSLPESGRLPSAFSRALGKAAFAESRTRQSPALGNELVY